MVEPRYRTFGRRVGALLLDRLPFHGLEQASGLVSSTFGSLYFGLAWGQLLGWAWIAYRVLTHGVWGQTLGKKICKVRVVDLSGQRLSMKQAVLREIVPIVLNLASVLYLALNWEAYLSWAAGGEVSSRFVTGGTVYTLAVGIWWLAQLIAVAVNQQRRAIHDFIAGSVVLRLDVQEVRPESEAGGSSAGTIEPETGRDLHQEESGHWLSTLEGLGRPGMAAMVAVAAAVTTLIFPTLLILDGETCPGYQVDVLDYYMKLAPLALGAALLGALLGAVIDWPGYRLAETEGSSRRFGWGIAVLVAAGVGLALISCFLAVFPGC